MPSCQSRVVPSRLASVSRRRRGRRSCEMCQSTVSVQKGRTGLGLETLASVQLEGSLQFASGNQCVRGRLGGEGRNCVYKASSQHVKAVQLPLQSISPQLHLKESHLQSSLPHTYPFDYPHTSLLNMPPAEGKICWVEIPVRTDAEKLQVIHPT